MIRELLRPEKVVLGLAGEFAQALEALLARSSFPERRAEIRSALLKEGAGGDAFLAPNVAVPHVRLEVLPSAELILGLAPQGVRWGDRVAKVILFLATPADQAARHLQLLQRLSSLLPTLAEELVAKRDVLQVLKAVAQGEDRAGTATYINLTQEQVALELHTDLEHGLTAAEVRHRLAVHGPNVLRRVRRTPWTVKLVRNLFSFFAVLLWLAALLCFVPGVDMPQLGTAILAVILVNGLFSFLQEQRSDRAVEALQGLLSQGCRVIREGRPLGVDAATLVPGDIILLDEGDVVPADARLTEAFEVEVDDSTLTGESTSAKRYKSDRPILLTGRFLWIELPNIVFAGTSLVRGHARAVVFGTGMGSEIGKIAGLTQAIRAEDSPLQRGCVGPCGPSRAWRGASAWPSCCWAGWPRASPSSRPSCSSSGCSWPTSRRGCCPR